jgi:hypothetical protein
MTSSFWPNFYVFRDDGELTQDDWIIAGYALYQQPLDQSLPAGNYILAIADDFLNLPSAVSGTKTNARSGEYTVTIRSLGGAWHPTDQPLQWGLQGNELVLDAAQFNPTVYRIVENGENSVVIDTPDDLSGYVGKALLGIHQFDQLSVRGGAHVDAGVDRVIVRDVGTSLIDGTSTVTAGPGSVLP